ncbi:MAG: AzlC family ABC transporter permease [Dehalococcoidia bacterium]|nr:AzlC family ABC transporter permease [Dehalococcoidia bacterium]
MAVGAFGVSYGLLATTTGFGGLAAFVMSLTTFSGASQFASLSVLASGGGVTAAVVAAVLLAARYGPIGISVAPSITGNAVLRFLQAQLIIDESWAVSNRGDGTVDRDMLLGAGGLIFIAWAAGTVIGVFGGDIFRDPEALGLDAAFPALFLGLLLSQINGRRAVVAALLGGVIAFALIPFAKAGIPIIAASVAALVGLRRE